MGTWGTGNFADDEAMDAMTNWTRGIVQELESAIQAITMDAKEKIVNGETFSWFPCQLEILTKLAKDYTATQLPTVEKLTEWESSYIQVFNTRVAPRWFDKAEVAERKRIITKTFAEAKAARDWQDW